MVLVPVPVVVLLVTLVVVSVVADVVVNDVVVNDVVVAVVVVDVAVVVEHAASLLKCSHPPRASTATPKSSSFPNLHASVFVL